MDIPTLSCQLSAPAQTLSWPSLPKSTAETIHPCTWGNPTLVEDRILAVASAWAMVMQWDRYSSFRPNREATPACREAQLSTELSRADPLHTAEGGRLTYKHLCIREQRDKALPRFDVIHRTNSRLVNYFQNVCNKVSAFYHHRRHQISHQILARTRLFSRGTDSNSHTCAWGTV